MTANTTLLSVLEPTSLKNASWTKRKIQAATLPLTNFFNKYASPPTYCENLYTPLVTTYVECIEA